MPGPVPTRHLARPPTAAPHRRHRAVLSGLAVLGATLALAVAPPALAAAPVPSVPPATAVDIPAYCASPPAFPGGIEGVPAFLAPRLCGYVQTGVDPGELLAALRSVPAGAGPGSPAWVATFTAVGDARAASAERAAGRHHRERIQRALLDAAFYYFLARFPYPFSPAAAQAYDKHVAAVVAAAGYEPRRGRLAVVTIPTDAGTLTGHLRLPAGRRGHAPLVVVLGGIDEWKSDPSVILAADALRATGYATLTLDIPATGQNPQRVAAPGGASVLAAAVRLAGSGALDGVDPERIGVYGISYGGHYAAALALTEPLVDAAVNLSGPIEESLGGAWCAALPVPTLATLAATLGLSFGAVGVGVGVGGTCAALVPLRFSTQGLIPVTGASAPVLSINGDADPLIAPGDFDVLGRSGAAEDTVVFAGDGHLAGGNAEAHQALAATWLARRLR